jgi:hypothetical protein
MSEKVNLVLFRIFIPFVLFFVFLFLKKIGQTTLDKRKKDGQV